jgi:hypothetical protein
VRGEWGEGDAYARLDIVVYKDASHIAVRDNPGRPADDGGGWMMLAGRGSKGEAGPRGHKGAPGKAEPPVTIHSWLHDLERYGASPLLSNGQVRAMLELRPFFLKFRAETRDLRHACDTPLDC